MSEKVLGIIRVMRLPPHPFARQTTPVYDDLFLTSDRVIVARVTGGGYTTIKEEVISIFLGGTGITSDIIISAKKAEKESREALEKEHLELPLEDVLKADKHNFAIPKSDITKVELKSRMRAKVINIITNKKKHNWYLFLKKGVKLEDYENIIRQAFPNKLSVKK